MAARIPWRTVFVCEYTAPLIVFPAVSKAGPFSTLASTLWTVHFAKRLAETLFVHKFSKGTMPLTNLFKNCGYYGGAAALVGWDVPPRPLQRAAREALRAALAKDESFVAAWALCEVLNLYTHLHLASLRSDGSREAKIPDRVALPARMFAELLVRDRVVDLLFPGDAVAGGLGVHDSRRVADGHVGQNKTEAVQAQVQGRGGVQGDALLPGVLTLA